MSRTLLLFAHPRLEHSRVSRALLEAARRRATTDPRLVVRDLYARYPDYLIDVGAEQADLAMADRVVWVHPFHWYGMPPLLKLWVDDVLALGWAYGGGNALVGKRLWLVTSTGGGEESYRPDGHNRHAFDDFLPPYRQTAALCGMVWQPPLVLHGAHRASEAELAGFVDRFDGHLRDALAASADDRDHPGVPECAVPADARPLPEVGAPSKPGWRRLRALG